jgi:hypothetical protein
MCHRIAVLLCLFLGTSVHAQDKALLLFGGEGHKTFLGCLNCGKYDSGSVCNKYGDHGSKYASNSMWNKYGDFGGKYSDGSPFNQYAANPPAIVDRDGGFYGYLTANNYNSKRTRIKALVALTDLSEEIANDPEPIADRFCGRD